MHSILTICGLLFRRQLREPRIWLILLLCIDWLHALIAPMRSFAATSGEPVNPLVMPFVFTLWPSSVLFCLLSVLLFCDAPFENNASPYECIRSGRTQYILGRLLFLCLASLVLTACVFALSVLWLIPEVRIGEGWGRVLRTLAQDISGVVYRGIPISYSILRDFSPAEAAGRCATLLFLVSWLIGIVMAAVNTAARRKGVGILIGIVLSLLPTLQSFFVSPQLFWFLPTTWANLTLMDADGHSMYAPFGYMVGVLGVTLLFLNGLLVGMYRRQETEIGLPA